MRSEVWKDNGLRGLCLRLDKTASRFPSARHSGSFLSWFLSADLYGRLWQPFFLKARLGDIGK